MNWAHLLFPRQRALVAEIAHTPLEAGGGEDVPALAAAHHRHATHTTAGRAHAVLLAPPLVLAAQLRESHLMLFLRRLRLRCRPEPRMRDEMPRLVLRLPFAEGEALAYEAEAEGGVLWILFTQQFLLIHDAMEIGIGKWHVICQEVKTMGTGQTQIHLNPTVITFHKSFFYSSLLQVLIHIESYNIWTETVNKSLNEEANACRGSNSSVPPLHHQSIPMVI
ncbi:hypothetical protein E2562_020937 [Oryza meyeriana var. granulata]|uniref:Uncharacterized protein n=1 Tax=Oryza meyeriana var. granulata TaxID=110450 RepID=A0A6G1DYT4_9ORYZ|nr:hypothetical protein E2562_020937 [Oryza meyeriana var. granulata]